MTKDMIGSWFCCECGDDVKEEGTQWHTDCDHRLIPRNQVKVEGIDKPKQQEKGKDENKKRNDRFTFEIEVDASKTTIQVLDHKISVLRPQTFIPEKNQKLILVYLPTKQEIQKGYGKLTVKNTDFSNSAFFITSKPKNSIGLQREIIPIQSQDLINK